MLFSRNNNESGEPKKRSLLGFLFNPDFGSDIRPIRQNFAMFLRMIAVIFASSGLFPKNHPALTGALPPDDPRARLTLMYIINMGWNSFSFTKEDLPKAVMFCAFVGALAFSVMAFFMIAMSLFIGSAQAQGMFSVAEANKGCDLVLRWLDYLFLGKDINAGSGCTVAMPPVPSVNAVQQALQLAFAYYSTGVLVIAGVILLYHLTFMVAETAHTGKVMGRGSQIWAPIRLVVAIGLLVPVGSGTGGDSGGVSLGLNSGQYIVIQMAKWGTGLANNVWDMFLDGLVKTNYALVPTPAPSSQIIAAVTNIVKMEACMLAYNNVLTEMMRGIPVSDDYLVRKFAQTVACEPCKGGGEFSGLDCDYVPQCKEYFYSNLDKSVSCGSFKVLPSPTAGSGPNQGYDVSAQALAYSEELYKAHQRGIDNTYNKAGDSADFIKYKYTAYGGEGYTKDHDAAARQAISALAVEYVKQFEGVSDRAQVDITGNLQKIKEDWGRQGWAAAGAWFNNVARAQGVVFSGGESFVPETKPPDLDSMGAQDFLGSVKNFWTGFFGSEKISNDTLNNVHETVRQALFLFDKDVLSKPISLGGRYAGPETTAAAGTANLTSGNNMAKGVLWSVDMIGVTFGIWPKDNSRLFIHFGKTGNPLAEVAFFGYGILGTGLYIMGVAGIGTGVAALIGSIAPLLTGVGASAVGVLSQVSGLLLAFVATIGVALIVSGVMLGFLLPLVPFLKFFFNVITWLLIVFEAVVSAPLFALAHLTPHGEGLPGEMAKRGYFYILSILLKPAMMIFGLIAGLLLFYVAIFFLNAVFNIAVAGSGSWKGDFAVVSKIIFTVMYAVTAYTCANTCFKTISYFSEHGLNWMNASGLTGHPMGDRGMMTGLVTSVASTYAGHKALDAFTGVSKSVGEGVGGHFAKSKAEAVKKAENQKMLDAIAASGKSEEIVSAIKGYKPSKFQMEQDKKGYTGRVIPVPGSAPPGSPGSSGQSFGSSSGDIKGVAQSPLPPSPLPLHENAADTAYADVAPQLDALKNTDLSYVAPSGNKRIDSNEKLLRKYHQNRIIAEGVKKYSGALGGDTKQARQLLIARLKSEGRYID